VLSKDSLEIILSLDSAETIRPLENTLIRGGVVTFNSAETILPFENTLIREA